MPRSPKPLPSVAELFRHRFGLDADPKIAEPPAQLPLPGLLAEEIARRIAAKHAPAEAPAETTSLAAAEPEEVLLEKKRPRRVTIIER